MLSKIQNQLPNRTNENQNPNTNEEMVEEQWTTLNN
jgi:hypothetical protein